MGMELDLLNHDVVKQLVAEAYRLGYAQADSGGLEITNEEIVEEMKELHTEQNQEKQKDGED